MLIILRTIGPPIKPSRTNLSDALFDLDVSKGLVALAPYTCVYSLDLVRSLYTLSSLSFVFLPSCTSAPRSRILLTYVLLLLFSFPFLSFPFLLVAFNRHFLPLSALLPRALHYSSILPGALSAFDAFEIKIP